MAGSKELIVASNPARKRRQSPAQRRASLKNLRKARASRRRKPARRRRRRNVYTAAPARRRAPAARRRAAPAAPRRRRSNPRRFRGFQGIINNQVMPALIGGTGAVLNDVGYGFIPLPEMLRTGPMRHIGKAGTALVMAWLSSFVVGKRTADQLGAGALTVVGYNVVRELVARFAPGVPMGEYLDPALGYYGAGLDPGAGLSEYLEPGVGQIPGTGVDTYGQLTQGTPYMADTMGTTWPTQLEEETYYNEYDEYA